MIIGTFELIALNMGLVTILCLGVVVYRKLKS